MARDLEQLLGPVKRELMDVCMVAISSKLGKRIATKLDDYGEKPGCTDSNLVLYRVCLSPQRTPQARYPPDPLQSKPDLIEEAPTASSA